MAEHVNNNLWGPLREAVEQAGERAKELNGQARKLAVAAVQDARKLAVAAAQDARTRAVNLATEASEPVVKLAIGSARSALEKVGAIEVVDVVAGLGKRVAEVRARVEPYRGQARKRVDSLLQGLNLAVHSHVVDLEKRLDELEKRIEGRKDA
jgi:hypothetical protein